MCTFRGEIFPFEVEELITHLIIMCDYEPSMSVATYVTYGKVLRETIVSVLRLGGQHCNLRTKNHEITCLIVLFWLP